MRFPRRICRHGDPKCVTIKTIDAVRPLCDRCVEDSIRGIVGKDVTVEAGPVKRFKGPEAGPRLRTKAQ